MRDLIERVAMAMDAVDAIANGVAEEISLDLLARNAYSRGPDAVVAIVRLALTEGLYRGFVAGREYLAHKGE